MRFVRSILCVGLAMMAVGLCAAMPASAAVPMEVHAIIQPLTAKECPAPAIAVVQEDVAMLPSVMPAIEGNGGGRSSIFAGSLSLASTSAPVNVYQHIDPDIAG
ncbi:hypothetical protein [Rhizobium rhizogenes]|uniref:hypothetical protein n=1 Tax=Rhizobium rhizogenes TaxID=359 RepID=UPI0004DADB99|nr:hypothetical protein [Rhizobium rhizogenes]KEA07139.1 hypothetical protein CN09_09335 [Rhizobium rhizogenes]NTI80427.1 hypothetical protein [Rhizobium rhizogenes]NTJ22613.1 hypothetical protein [Rhizobium rhizogenes]QUE81317.1 hypothetical protein EML492_05790 [Rhizobium rhizogenes]TQO80585.1 hypothetical protein FFE80_05645 [Rhizobium rhizogenes]